MSASREQKSNEGMASSGRSDPKTAREAQKRKEIRRSNILYGTIAVVFVLVAIVTFVWKSNIVQKAAGAVTINGEKYTAAEVNYYYKNVYRNFLSNYSSYLSVFGLDTSKSLKDQDCAMAIVGALQDGLTGDHTTLFAKSLLDGISSIVFASSLGIGVTFSAAAVLIYQGLIAILASLISPFLGPDVIAEMTCVGSLLIVALALNMLGMTKIKVMTILIST